MHIKGKYSWIKHIDFLLIDLLALFCSFLLSYSLTFGNIQFMESRGWSTLILVVLMLDIIFNLVMNPYSGMFRTAFYLQFLKSFKLMSYNLIVTSVLLYVMKMGHGYSRGVILGTYLIYYCLSLALKYLWKKILLTGKINVFTAKTKSLFIIGSKENIKEVIKNTTAADFRLYDISGVYLIDNDESLCEIDGIPVVRDNYSDYILTNNIDEVLNIVL